MVKIICSRWLYHRMINCQANVFTIWYYYISRTYANTGFVVIVLCSRSSHSPTVLSNSQDQMGTNICITSYYLSLVLLLSLYIVYASPKTATQAETTEQIISTIVVAYLIYLYRHRWMHYIILWQIMVDKTYVYVFFIRNHSYNYYSENSYQSYY